MARPIGAEIAKLAKEHQKFIEDEFAAPAQPKILTMAPKVAVEVAMPGWQPKGGTRREGFTIYPRLALKTKLIASWNVLRLAHP